MHQRRDAVRTGATGTVIAAVVRTVLTTGLLAVGLAAVRHGGMSAGLLHGGEVGIVHAGHRHRGRFSRHSRAGLRGGDTERQS